jgi:MYXO-CTERM domain-containing protein
MVTPPRRAFRLPVVLLVAAVWLHAGVASAVPIGDFSWDVDEFGLFGPFFSVANFSSDLPGFSGSFFDVFVDLDTGAGFQEIPILFEDGLSIIPAGGAAQSTDDLSGVTISRASLRLTFEHGPVVVAELNQDVLSTVIDFTPPPPPDSGSVPEPSPFGMVALGLVALWTLRIRRWAKSH